MNNFIALALVTAATALPTAAPTADPENGEFVTYMTVLEGTTITLNAMNNGTYEDLVIVGERPSAYPGTTTIAERNFEDAGDAVSFLIDGERYGWVVVDAVSWRFYCAS